MSKFLDRLGYLTALTSFACALACAIFLFTAPHLVRNVGYVGAACFFTSVILWQRKAQS